MMPLPVHCLTAPHRLVFPLLHILHLPQKACAITRQAQHVWCCAQDLLCTCTISAHVRHRLPAWRQPLHVCLEPLLALTAAMQGDINSSVCCKRLMRSLR